MNEFEKQEVVNTETQEVENPQTEFQNETDVHEEPAVEQPQQEEENVQSAEFEALQLQFDELQNNYNELKTNYENAQVKINELEEFQTTANEQLDTLRAENEQLKSSVQSYEAKINSFENDRKNSLIEKYEKIMDSEEIGEIKEKMNDFSYDELESKLAITFANSKMETSESKKVPLLEPQESQFALFMKNYRKD